MASIHVHIERLIVDGLPLDAAGGRAVRSAIEAEIARLLQTERLPAMDQSAAVARLPGETVQWNAKQTPANPGQQVGQAVYRSLGS